MSEDLAIPLDRVAWRDGQLLASRDLGDDVRRDARLRGLHTRYLHDTWGIALGFEIKTGAGQTSVIVGPGYAVDAYGRDILSPESVEVPAPDLEGPANLVLVASYLGDAAFRPAPDLANRTCRLTPSGSGSAWTCPSTALRANSGRGSSQANCGFSTRLVGNTRFGVFSRARASRWSHTSS